MKERIFINNGLALLSRLPKSKINILEHRKWNEVDKINKLNDYKVNLRNGSIQFHESLNNFITIEYDIENEGGNQMNQLDDIKELLNEANEISERITNSNLVACADEDRISDILSEMFRECHIDWLIEKVEELKKINRLLNMEIGKYSAIIGHIASENDEITKKLEQVRTTMLNGGSNND